MSCPLPPLPLPALCPPPGDPTSGNTHMCAHAHTRRHRATHTHTHTHTHTQSLFFPVWPLPALARWAPPGRSFSPGKVPGLGTQVWHRQHTLPREGSQPGGPRPPDWRPRVWLWTGSVHREAGSPWLGHPVGPRAPLGPHALLRQTGGWSWSPGFAWVPLQRGRSQACRGPPPTRRSFPSSAPRTNSCWESTCICVCVCVILT